MWRAVHSARDQKRTRRETGLRLKGVSILTETDQEELSMAIEEVHIFQLKVDRNGELEGNDATYTITSIRQLNFKFNLKFSNGSVWTYQLESKPILSRNSSVARRKAHITSPVRSKIETESSSESD